MRTFVQHHNTSGRYGVPDHVGVVPMTLPTSRVRDPIHPHKVELDEPEPEPAAPPVSPEE